jgi:hypothetical protein
MVRVTGRTAGKGRAKGGIDALPTEAPIVSPTDRLRERLTLTNLVQLRQTPDTAQSSTSLRGDARTMLRLGLRLTHVVLEIPQCRVKDIGYFG